VWCYMQWACEGTAIGLRIYTVVAELAKKWRSLTGVKQENAYILSKMNGTLLGYEDWCGAQAATATVIFFFFLFLFFSKNVMGDRGQYSSVFNSEDVCGGCGSNRRRRLGGIRRIVMLGGGGETSL